MKLKTVMMSAAVVAATVGGSTLVISPAHALSGKFSVNLNNRVNSVLATGIDLKQDINSDAVDDPFGFNNKTGDFSSYTSAFVSNFSFGTMLSNGSNSDISLSVPSFITLTGGSLGSITFDLTKLTEVIFSSGSDGTGAQGSFFAQIKGIFQPSGAPNASTIDAIAAFRLSQGGNGGSIDLTAVPSPIPTPALLPGLIAMGVGIIRKQKSKAAEMLEADA